MIVLDVVGLLLVLGSAGFLGFVAGRQVGRREGQADEAAALRRSLLLDLQTRASLDPAYEPRFVELVQHLLDPPRPPR